MKLDSIKSEIRILGLDDAPFRFGDKSTRLLGTVFRGGYWLDGLLTEDIEVDGTDCTKKIIGMVEGSPHRKQIRVIMLDGVTFGGFNVADMGKINDKTGIPVVAVVRDRPDMPSIRKALSRFEDAEERWQVMIKAGPVKPVRVKNPKTGKLRNIWFQASGIGEEVARELIRVSSTRSFIPEPLRVAHIIGQGLGRSNGR